MSVRSNCMFVDWTMDAGAGERRAGNDRGVQVGSWGKPRHKPPRAGQARAPVPA